MQVSALLVDKRVGEKNTKYKKTLKLSIKLMIFIKSWLSVKMFKWPAILENNSDYKILIWMKDSRKGKYSLHNFL